MFLGTFEHKLDAKNRVILPARFRDTLNQLTGSLELYLAPGMEKCIFGFDKNRFQKVVDSFEAKEFAQQATRKFVRLFFGHASQVECDGMGRILIPDFLRNLAKINKEVVLVGTSTRFEIWAKEIWTEEGTPWDEYESLADQMM